MEDFVTYEQAIKLKELGFDWKVNHYYNSGKDLCENLADYSAEDIAYGEDTSYENFNNSKFLGLDCSTPTLAQAAKWLREKYNLYIAVFVDHYEGTDPNYIWEYELRDIKTGSYMGGNIEIFASYEKALSAGIDEALKLIENK